jgi:hypothetical protein
VASFVRQSRFIFLLILVTTNLWSQSPKRIYHAVDKIMENTPDSVTSSTDLFIKYLRSTFKTDHEIVRAIYYWIGHHIEYKIDSSNYNQDSAIKQLSNSV